MCVCAGEVLVMRIINSFSPEYACVYSVFCVNYNKAVDVFAPMVL